MEVDIAQAYDRPTMAASVVGRDAELASILDFVAHMSREAAALVLEGDAGMGKTTLWRVTIEQAEGSGVLVLQAQPVESEMTLSFAGLGDLLDPVLARVSGSLPAIQERALNRALALGDEDESGLDPRTLRVAVMNLIRGLAEERPVLVAIDDSQWLDLATSAALAYAVRRFRSERVGLLLARRSGLESALLSELLRSPAGERFTSVPVGSLDDAELGRVVYQHFGKSLPRPLLAEVRQASGGNPFFALEIVRTLDRSRVSVEAGRPLPVPDSLHGLVHDRLLALPLESRDFLLAAAAHAQPTVKMTEAASGVTADAGLGPAVDAGIVELDGPRIRFTHPLLAAGVLEAADPGRRLEVHARLADLLEDPEARAWQLAACRPEPDETVAAALEAASVHARARGAPRPAALLLDRAAELTPTSRPHDRVRREVDAAYLHFEAGDSPRAEGRLREVIAPLDPGPLRARALVVLARIRLYERPQEAKELFLQVIDEAGADHRTLAIAYEGAAACSLWMFQDFEESLRHSEAAFALSVELADDVLTGDIVMTLLAAETFLGKPNATATADKALALQRVTTEVRILDQPLVALAERWTWLDEHERSCQAILDLMASARDFGDENARPWLLCLLTEAELPLGSLDVALEHAREARDAAQQSGQPLIAAIALAHEAHVSAQLGLDGEARRCAAHVRSEDRGDRYSLLVAAAAIGHLELSAGAAKAAADTLEPWIAFVTAEGIVEPGATRFVIDHAEALIELARRDEAGGLLDWYEDNARRLGRVSALANCARCRGLLTAQEGDLDRALATFDKALELHRQVNLPLDRGRTLLALGAAQRRKKRRREARATLEEALAVFEEIGAALWAERARAELKRISGRASTPGALTPAEERVAVLVAEGKTNKEVAAALFVSDRTVEGHLARVFGKLGIRHRTEIAGALQTQGIDLSNTGDSPVSAEPSAF